MKGADTPWRADRLLFGRMFEDWTIEEELFPPGARVFCIASAGCTALSLAAAGYEVSAVDINAAQVELVQRRAAGGASRDGAVDRMMAGGRAALAVLGWTRTRVRAFVDLDDPAEQSTFWRSRLDTRRFRAVLSLLLSPAVLSLFYASPLVRGLPPSFSRIIRQRLERGFSIHPNRSNPYARALLLGGPPLLGTRRGLLRLVHADAAGFLESSPPGSFGAFTLSNILDGAGEAYGERLRAAVDHAAAPGAVTILRSFSEPETAEEERWARRDRALLWGRLAVEHR